MRGTQHRFLVDTWAALSLHGSMARLSRIVLPGYPHHVTQPGVRRMDAGGRWSLAVSPAFSPAVSPALSGATLEKLTGQNLSKGRPRKAAKAPLVKNGVVSPDNSTDVENEQSDQTKSTGLAYLRRESGPLNVSQNLCGP
jgi:hypothetical protein